MSIPTDAELADVSAAEAPHLRRGRFRALCGVLLSPTCLACAGLICALLAAPSSAQAPAPVCRTIEGAVVVNLDDSRTPAAVAHVQRAVKRGQPWLLHIDREHADLHRRASLRGIQKVAGNDLDEYPPALAAEGGAGADVEPIPSSDNRSAGSKMGRALSPFCDGQAFIFQP